MKNELLFCKEQMLKIESSKFLKELLEAVKYLSIFETKIEDSRLERVIYLPKLEINEARSSLMIEGTHTKIEDYYQGQLFPEEVNLEMKELINHNIALQKGMRMVQIDGFTNENIQEIHRLLFSETKNIKAGITIGEYKKVNNYIGRNNIKIYEPPKVEETLEYMNDLIAFMNDSSTELHPLIKCAIIHAQFESIHPFEDGNGRLGRLLIPLYICKSGLLSAPLFYISESIEKDKYLYYSLLTETRTGDYNEWIRYFLQKCTEQAKKHIELMQKIDNLYKRTNEKIANITNSVLTPKLVNSIFMNPIITSKKMSENLNVSITQSNRYLKSLEEAKILYKNDRKRNISYYFGELLNLIS